MGGLVKGGVALPVIICPTTTTEREEKRESNLGGSLLTVNKGGEKVIRDPFGLQIANRNLVFVPVIHTFL